MYWDVINYFEVKFADKGANCQNGNDGSNEGLYKTNLNSYSHTFNCSSFCSCKIFFRKTVSGVWDLTVIMLWYILFYPLSSVFYSYIVIDVPFLNSQACVSGFFFSWGTRRMAVSINGLLFVSEGFSLWYSFYIHFTWCCLLAVPKLLTWSVRGVSFHPSSLFSSSSLTFPCSQCMNCVHYISFCYRFMNSFCFKFWRDIITHKTLLYHHE